MFPVKACFMLQLKPMRGAPSTVRFRELHELCVLTRLQLTHFSSLPVNGKGQPDSAIRLRRYNLCLWIMDIPSKWRPIYVLYHAPLHLFWLGLWLDSWQFYWWWTSWFIHSSQAQPSIKAPCQDRYAKCTVTCCLWLTDWLCSRELASCRTGRLSTHSALPLWLLPAMRH